MADSMLSNENVIADSGSRVFLCLLASPIGAKHHDRNPIR